MGLSDATYILASFQSHHRPFRQRAELPLQRVPVSGEPGRLQPAAQLERGLSPGDPLRLGHRSRRRQQGDSSHRGGGDGGWRRRGVAVCCQPRGLSLHFNPRSALCDGDAGGIWRRSFCDGAYYGRKPCSPVQSNMSRPGGESARGPRLKPDLICSSPPPPPSSSFQPLN